jgi:putative ABC transport system permease protein
MDRKLARDLRSHLGALVAIAVVVACGQAGFLAMRTMARTLERAQVTYYRTVRFPDLFATVRRAPDAVVPTLRAIPGIARLEVRAVGDIVVRVPGLREPATAHLVGIPLTDSARLNTLVLRSGRRPFPGERDAVLLSEGFAAANHFVLGDTLGAVIGDRWRALRVVGTAVTAEFVYEIRPGDMLPDARRYGIVWLDADVAADALGLRGAWNEVAATLAPGADTARVLAALDRALDRYGTPGAYTREQHASHRFLSEEIRQNQTFALVLPMIFLGVAAFLVHLVLGRVVAQQREQVGTLTAFGMPPRMLLRHYGLFALVPVSAGTLLGAGIGLWFARYLASVYADFFRFPTLRLALHPTEFTVAVIIAIAAAGLGAFGALRRLLALAPAEAMRPEPPATYAHGRVERLLARWARRPVPRMTLRNLTHRPWRTALGALGIGLGAAVVVAGTFGFDAVRRMRTVLFEHADRADVTIIFGESQGTRALAAAREIPGVLAAEPIREIGVRIRHGHRNRRTALVAVDEDARLRQVVDLHGRVVRVPDGGIALGTTLARVLGAAVGDTVDLEFLDGRDRRRSAPVTAVVEDLAGLNAYVPQEMFGALVGVSEAVSAIGLAVDPAATDAVYARLTRAPAVRAVTVRAAVRRAFDETLRRNFVIVLTTLVSFAAALAAGTIYNAGRVALSERARDLASLRVLGLTRGEVARILFGELATLGVIGVPVGVVIGIGFAAATVASFGETELFRMPLVIGWRTIAAAIAIPTAAGMAAARPLRRRLDRLDLIGVLKTRE